MKIVAKNPMWDKKHLCFFHVDEFHTFYGDRIPTPNWVESDSICITADIPSKMRIIPRKWILSIDDEAQAPIIESTSIVNKTLKVKGSKGEIYTLTINGKNKNCTCAGFSFRRTCKHIREAA